MREQRGGSEVPINACNGKMRQGGAVEAEDMGNLLGNDLDPYPSIYEIHYRHRAFLLSAGGLRCLFGSETVGDGYMAPRGVDACHLAAEERAVGGSVIPLIDSDIVVNHLVEDGVFDKVLREVDAGIDTQDEIRVLHSAEQAAALLAEAEFAEEALRIAQPNGDRMQKTIEIQYIVFIELAFDI